MRERPEEDTKRESLEDDEERVLQKIWTESLPISIYSYSVQYVFFFYNIVREFQSSDGNVLFFFRVFSMCLIIRALI